MKKICVYSSRGIHKTSRKEGIYMSNKRNEYASPEFFNYLLESSEEVRKTICKEISKNNDIESTQVVLQSIQAIDRLKSEMINVSIVVLSDNHNNMYIILMGKIDTLTSETILAGMTEFVNEHHTYKHLYKVGILLPTNEKTTSY